jgi:hypothetical protein
MREFFGLIIFVILICLWSWVFADSPSKDYKNDIKSKIEHGEGVKEIE